MGVSKIKVTHQELMAVLNYDKDTGEFSWRDNGSTHWTRRSRGGVGTITAKGQRLIAIKRKNYAAHRLAWLYVTGEWPKANIVPINEDYLDLRFANLKEESISESCRKHAPRKGTSSGIRGVSFDKSRSLWAATIRVNGKQKALGRFRTKEEAGAAYEKALKEMRVHSLSEDEITEALVKREIATRDARYRALFKRTVRDAAGVTGWASAQEFRDDIGDELRDFACLKAIDPERPIGPGNWEWNVTLYSQFDTSTREGRIAYESAKRGQNPLFYRDRDLRKTFGVTLAQYMEMLEAQGGVCASCHRPEREKRFGKLRWLSVDHCHTTGEIRGLLCGNCNRGIGKFKDSPELLRKGADYLERHAKKSKH